MRGSRRTRRTTMRGSRRTRRRTTRRGVGGQGGGRQGEEYDDKEEVREGE
ncbi:unnamed protein product [Nesidiocoris tenuis]|uniref:Uncharacterized protein n=1 Tax=Nesidiocoris tenuis TaxID=355587 RepID=A0A6H5GFT6_9HEMI|nr:unnamed protein product [Nesidiocoris tenuis]